MENDDKYLPELLAEKDSLDSSFTHAMKLLNAGKVVLRGVYFRAHYAVYALSWRGATYGSWTHLQTHTSTLWAPCVGTGRGLPQ